MFKYVYNGRTGEALPDHTALAQMMAHVEAYNAAPNCLYRFSGSTENSLIALRLLAKQGLIDPDRIDVWYSAPGTLLYIGTGNEGLYPVCPPVGFADTTANMLRELF